jgi:hypothetical protein
MKLLFSLLLTIGGIGGVAISFLSSIVINSSVSFIDGAELSIWLGWFSFLVFLNGMYNLLSSN